MARKRLISPEFFTHPDLYEAEVRSGGLPLRLAFAGLWCQADRAGRFAWVPRVLQLHILPFDQVDFEAVLESLEREGFIVRYVVDGKAFGAIPSFSRWQTFHKTERSSRLPAPPAAQGATSVDAPHDNGTLTVKAPLSTRATTGAYTAVTGTGTGTGAVTGVTTSEPVADRRPVSSSVVTGHEPPTATASAARPRQKRGEAAADVPPKPKRARVSSIADAEWLQPIRQAYEARRGPGTFEAVAGRWAAAFRGIVKTAGGRHCGFAVHYALRPNNPKREFLTPEWIAGDLWAHHPHVLWHGADDERWQWHDGRPVLRAHYGEGWESRRPPDGRLPHGVSLVSHPDTDQPWLARLEWPTATLLHAVSPEEHAALIAPAEDAACR